MPKPLSSRLALAILLLLVSAAGAAEAASQVTPRTADPVMAGTWEGFVETSRQSVMTRIHIVGGADPTATVTLQGRELVVEDLRIRGDSLGYVVHNGPQRLAFSGARSGSRVIGAVTATVGQASADTTQFEFELRRLSTFGPPATPAEARRQDLDHARNRFLAYDRSYSSQARQRAEGLLDDLESRLANLSDVGFALGLARVAAASDNAHTRAYLLRNRTAVARVPLRVWWFSDGLHVVGATEPLHDLLGCRVETVGGVDSAVARDSVATLFAGNEGWTDYKSAYYLTSPPILNELGLADDATAITLELSCDGEDVVRTVMAAPLQPRDEPVENWKSLAPNYPGDGSILGPDADTWRAALGPSSVPPHLARPDRNYAFELLREGVAYLQYNRSQNARSGESLTDFAQRVEASLASQPADLVVDLRFNTGGDLGQASGFFERLITGQRGRGLAVLVGQATFSAGLFHAAQLSLGGATVVGSGPGDRLDYWSEGGNIVLPNSRYVLHFANGYHSYSGRPAPRVSRVFRTLDVGAPSLTPDIAVSATSADYLAGRDPVLAAALRALGH